MTVRLVHIGPGGAVVLETGPSPSQIKTCLIRLGAVSPPGSPLPSRAQDPSLQPGSPQESPLSSRAQGFLRYLGAQSHLSWSSFTELDPGDLVISSGPTTNEESFVLPGFSSQPTTGHDKSITAWSQKSMGSIFDDMDSPPERGRALASKINPHHKYSPIWREAGERSDEDSDQDKNPVGGLPADVDEDGQSTNVEDNLLTTPISPIVSLKLAEQRDLSKSPLVEKSKEVAAGMFDFSSNSFSSSFTSDSSLDEYIESRISLDEKGERAVENSEINSDVPCHDTLSDSTVTNEDSVFAKESIFSPIFPQLIRKVRTERSSRLRNDQSNNNNPSPPDPQKIVSEKCGQSDGGLNTAVKSLSGGKGDSCVKKETLDIHDKAASTDKEKRTIPNNSDKNIESVGPIEHIATNGEISIAENMDEHSNHNNTQTLPSKDDLKKKIKFNAPFKIKDSKTDCPIVKPGRPVPTFIDDIPQEKSIARPKRKLDKDSKTRGNVGPKKKKVSKLTEDKVTVCRPEAKVRVAEGPVFIPLNEGTGDATWCQLGESKEFCFTILYHGGVTDFSSKTSFTQEIRMPKEILLRSESPAGETSFYSLDLKEIKLCEQKVLQRILLRADVRKIAFDAKLLLKTMLSYIKSFTPKYLSDHGLVVLDPSVGCWILQPDQSFASFSDCCQLLAADTELPACSGSYSEAHQDLDTLSKITASLFTLLYQEKLWNVFYNTEMRLLPLLVKMEEVGVRIDVGAANRTGQILKEECERIERQSQKMAGTEFNLASAKQVREILFDQLKLDVKAGMKVSKTPRGEKTTSETVLKQLEKVHALPGMILKHRQLMKSKTTYVDGLLQHSLGGKICTTWDQIGAATGRLTSVAPNLQAIPKSAIDVGGKSISLRSLLLPSPGYTYLSADYEQIELRVLAHLSGDPQLISAINTGGGDIFQQLAAIWREKSVAEVGTEERDVTKHVVYALMYGAGKWRLAELLNVDLVQAQGIIASFYAKFPQLKSFNKTVINRAGSNGCLVTMFGRRRFFPNINSNNMGLRAQSQRQAFNFLIQGSAADIAKNALIVAEKKLAEAGLDVRIVLMIHDELVWEIKREAVEECGRLVSQSLEDISAIFPAGIAFKIPLRVRLATGANLATLAPC